MALKNSQYDMIIREYQKKQLQTRHDQDARIREAYEKVPALREIDDQISSISVARGRQLLSGDSDAVDGLKEDISRLSDKRLELLMENGFPKDYLLPRYTCPDCQDTGFANNQKCHCFKQAVIDMLYTQSNLKEILSRENFSSFSYDYYSDQLVNPSTGLSSLATMRKNMAECEEFIRTFDTEFKNLFFYGDTGVGKTFLSHCIAKELIDTAHSVIYFSAFELFDVFAKSTFEKEEEAQNIHPYIFDCDLLIIDDLGTELTNSFVSTQLFLCINERLNRKKSTIISTNLPINTFADTYSERVFSRITSNYMMMKLFGDDIRIQKKLFRGKP